MVGQKLYVFAWTIAVVVSITAQEKNDGMFTSDNKVDCVNKMVDWCGDMKYPSEGAGLSMISIAYTDGSGNIWRIFCASDSDGTNCTRNRSPWFSCSSDQKLIYKGTQLNRDSVDGIDDEICNSTKAAFNDIFIQNLSYDPTNADKALDKGFESFFDEMAKMQEEIERLRNWILNNFESSFAGFPAVTQSPNSNNTNEIERE